MKNGCGPGGGRRAWAVALAVGLALLPLCHGCSDDPPPEEAERVTGKTPVVRPEDVHRRGSGGAAVLSPDYRQALTASLEDGPAASGKSKDTPKLSDPATGRLFTGQAAVTRTAKPAPVPGPAAAAPAGPLLVAAAPTPSAPVATPAAPAAAAPASAPASAQASTAFPVADCRQLVLVVAKDFAATSGMLRRFERPAPGAPWHEVGGAVGCRLGRRGLALGRGLVSLAGGPDKKQGDGRSPAGLFRLPGAFGYADEAAAKAAGVQLPYVALTDRSACVTEPGSPLFGRVTGPEAREGVGTLRQDRMVRDDRANVWGVVIGHNSDQPDPGAGTCLFLNVRSPNGPPTGGSIGCDEAATAGLMAWLDPAAAPVLAVLPERLYRENRQAWGLPEGI